MRPHYEAIGRVAGAAVANGDTIVNSYDIPSNERGHLGLHIEHRDTTLRVNADPGAQYLNASVTVRLDKDDDFDSSTLPPVAEVRRALFSETDIENFDGSIRVIESHPNGNDEVAIFAGIRIDRPLYAYDSEFSFEHYREVIPDLVYRLNTAFGIVRDDLDTEFTKEESLSSDDDEVTSGAAFH